MAVIYDWKVEAQMSRGMNSGISCFSLNYDIEYDFLKSSGEGDD